MNDGEGSRPPASLPPPLSPCIRICVVDGERGLCTGCLRTMDEIALWWAMADDEKRAVLAALPGRSLAPPTR